MKINRIVLES